MKRCIRVVPKRLWVLAAAAAVLLTAGPPSWATCGTSYCFLDTGAREGVQPKGLFFVDLSYQFVDQDRRRRGSGDVPEVLTPKISFEEGEIELDHHREVRTQNTLIRLHLAYGLTQRVTLFATLPLVNERDHEHFDLEEDPLGGPDVFEFTREDGTRGFGDIRLGARGLIHAGGRNLLVGNLGVELPTGAYRLLDRDGTINEPSIQPGSGSTDVFAGLRYARTLKAHRLDFFASTGYQLNTENDLDYELGDEWVLSAGVRGKAGSKLGWSAQVNYRHTDRDTFLGMPVPSTGSDLAAFSPGLSYQTSSGASVYGHVQVPVSQRVNESQLTPRFGLLLGVSKSF